LRVLVATAPVLKVKAIFAATFALPVSVSEAFALPVAARVTVDVPVFTFRETVLRPCPGSGDCRDDREDDKGNSTAALPRSARPGRDELIAAPIRRDQGLRFGTASVYRRTADVRRMACLVRGAASLCRYGPCPPGTWPSRDRGPRRLFTGPSPVPAWGQMTNRRRRDDGDRRPRSRLRSAFDPLTRLGGRNGCRWTVGRFWSRQTRARPLSRHRSRRTGGRTSAIATGRRERHPEPRRVPRSRHLRPGHIRAAGRGRHRGEHSLLENAAGLPKPH
jgi:hypothetical protein